MSKKRRNKPLPADAEVKPVQMLPPDDPFRRQNWLILILLVVALGVRVWLLMASRHYLRSDEAVVAMEAMDIMEGGPVPFFLYGQSYGGGHTVDALMAIPWFAFFGPSEHLFKLGQIILSFALVLVVYAGLYQFIGKRYALIAAAVFCFFSTFIQFSFFYNGGMAMSFFGWLGLYFFFRSYFDDKEKPVTMALCGASIGFACYCFEYAYYYLAAVIVLWLLKENIHVWRRWRLMLCFAGGFFAGAFPLIYFNLTHDFANFRFLLSMNSRPDSNMVLGILTRFSQLMYRDLPAFFSLSVDDFSESIPLVSYFVYSIFLISVIYTVVKTRSGIVALARAFFSGRRAILAPGERMVYVVLLVFIYFAIYSLSSAGGSTPRYLLAVCPLIPLIIAWPVYDLGRRHFVPAAIFIALFGIVQMYHIVALANDTTIVEWRIPMHGRDIKLLARYLLDNNLTTVLTPYEIKWKLMFESGRKIVCAAYAFGFDRENKYNMEVIERVNRKGMPLTVVFDKGYKMPQIALNFNPMGAFDLAGFHQFLQQNQITYQVTPVGEDYIVYHDFSKRFSIPDPYRGPLGAGFGLITSSP